MAIPERRDPNPPIHVGDLGDERRVENATRGGWRWWWVWPIAVALVFWWAGWGWGGTGGWWWGRAHSQNTAIPAPAGSRTTETFANAGAQQPETSAGAAAGSAGQALHMTGPGVKILTADNKQDYIGRHFEANDVPVLQKVNDRAIWIGGKRPMLAVITGNGVANGVVPGKTVDAQGIVKKAPPEAQAKREWSLSQDGANRLENDGAYLQISQLTIPRK